eukprot:4542127-Prymnesium_polylepis.1
MKQLSDFLRSTGRACHMRAPGSGRDIYVMALLAPDAAEPWRVECLLSPKRKKEKQEGSAGANEKRHRASRSQ